MATCGGQEVISFDVMKRIPLSKGKYFALVDDEDFEKLSKYTWSAGVLPRTIYASRKITISGKQTMIYMHQDIMKAPKGMDIDHINGNGLDNRKRNLRVCTRQQNCRSKRVADNKSGCKGISWNKVNKKWVVRIKYNGINYYLGSFADQSRAKEAYDMKANEVFGEFARV